jgi:hypothetical protein
MADLLQRGAVWLAGKLKNFAGQSITYRKSNQSTALTLIASPVRRDIEVVSDTAASDRIELWDFLITANDLEWGGVVLRPERGDKLLWTDGGVEYVHEALPAPSGNVWDFADAHHVMIAVHTKRINSGRC